MWKNKYSYNHAAVYVTKVVQLIVIVYTHIQTHCAELTEMNDNGNVRSVILWYDNSNSIGAIK